MDLYIKPSKTENGKKDYKCVKKAPNSTKCIKINNKIKKFINYLYNQGHYM